MVLLQQLLVVEGVAAEVCFLAARVLLMILLLLFLVVHVLLVVTMKILLMKIAMILLMKIAMILLIEVERPYQDTSYYLHHRDANLAHNPYYVDLEAT
jgi:sensor histidine kinase YesM